MSFKHHPGPWMLSKLPIELCNTDCVASIWGPINGEGGSALIADVSRSPGDEAATANAKLLASAPELLEALVWLVKDYEESDFDIVGKNESLIETAKYVIKKATE